MIKMVQMQLNKVEKKFPCYFGFIIQKYQIKTWKIKQKKIKDVGFPLKIILEDEYNGKIKKFL